jgi:hypothetical protein
MFHYAGANDTPVDRRAFIVVFALPPVPPERPYTFTW